MASVYGITKNLAQRNVDGDIAEKILSNKDLVDIVSKMEALLNRETVYSILDSCACGTSSRELGRLRKAEGQSIEEKRESLSRWGDHHSDWKIKVNPDNTLNVGWEIRNGSDYACVCSVAVCSKTKVSELTRSPRTMPLAYCACCAGHARRHLERILDVSLKTKQIVSSPLHSHGEKPCEFVFAIESRASSDRLEE